MPFSSACFLRLRAHVAFYFRLIQGKGKKGAIAFVADGPDGSSRHSKLSLVSERDSIALSLSVSPSVVARLHLSPNTWIIQIQPEQTASTPLNQSPQSTLRSTTWSYPPDRCRVYRTTSPSLRGHDSSTTARTSGILMASLTNMAVNAHQSLGTDYI